MYFSRLLIAALLSLHVSVGLAVGSKEPPANATDAVKEEFDRGLAAIAQKQWESAVGIFSGAVVREPRNADAWNWLGYSQRKAGRLDAAFKAYATALKLNPEHRGAHEYVGEAWLMAGKPEKAQEHLETLAKLCNARCEEYEDLKKAIAAWKAGQK